jgi:2-polyprenyl-6-methoxyphenol hydroxylase-like FAD-dependent oxidoreductase
MEEIMTLNSVLVIGGGIGGLTAAIALSRKGYSVEIIEKDPSWTVYGVGIIQQFNVVRAMSQIGMLDAYLEEAYGFDFTQMFAPNGHKVAEFPTPRLAGEQFPSNVGIRRTDLQQVLAKGARDLGVTVRLGLTAEALADDGKGVDVTFSDGATGRYDIVVGADGVFSRTRTQLFPDAPKPRYTGQWVWRYNFPQPDDVKCIQIYTGPKGAGLVPLGKGQMYMFLLSEEAPDFRLPKEGAAAIMRERMKGTPPQISALTDQVTVDADVVGRPLETVLVEGDWHKGRVVLIGDAVHACTPHLAQGAGLAIEDGLVLAEELEKADNAKTAFKAYRERRFERAKFIVVNSVRMGDSQMGKIEHVDMADLNRQMIGLMAQPI